MFSRQNSLFRDNKAQSPGKGQTINHEARIEIDLSKYCVLFCKKNTQNSPLSSEEEAAFKIEFSKLSQYFLYSQAGFIYENMLDEALNTFAENERTAIRKSPAIYLMHDSFSELLKNSIDAFLLGRLLEAKDQSRATSITPFSTSSESTFPDSNDYWTEDVDNILHFRLEVTSSEDQVSLIFTDSGPGFSDDFLENLSGEDHQLKYINQRKQHGYSPIKGLLGGRGLGLRQIICQILSGEELKPNAKNIQKHPILDSAIYFYNCPENFGACVKITTQKAPLLLENLTYNSQGNQLAGDQKEEDEVTMTLPPGKFG